MLSLCSDFPYYMYGIVYISDILVKNQNVMATLVDLTQLSFHLDLDLRADVIETRTRQGSKEAKPMAKFGLPKNVGKHF